MLNGNTRLSHWHMEALDVHVILSWDSLDRECVHQMHLPDRFINTLAHVCFGTRTRIEREREHSLLHLHFQSFVPLMF